MSSPRKSSWCAFVRVIPFPVWVCSENPVSIFCMHPFPPAEHVFPFTACSTPLLSVGIVESMTTSVTALDAVAVELVTKGVDDALFTLFGDRVELAQPTGSGTAEQRAIPWQGEPHRELRGQHPDQSTPAFRWMASADLSAEHRPEKDDVFDNYLRGRQLPNVSKQITMDGDVLSSMQAEMQAVKLENQMLLLRVSKLEPQLQGTATSASLRDWARAATPSELRQRRQELSKAYVRQVELADQMKAAGIAAAASITAAAPSNIAATMSSPRWAATPKADYKADYTRQQLRAATMGLEVGSLGSIARGLAAGIPLRVLRTAGESSRGSSYSRGVELRTAAKVAGFSIHEARAVKARAAGYTSAGEAKTGGGCATTCVFARLAGYSCFEAKAAGYSCAEAKATGYSCVEVQAAGYSCAEAKAAGYFAPHLRAAGYSCAEAKAAGFSCAEAKAAGFSCADAKAAGFSCADAKAAGFVAGLKAAGYTFAEAKDGGYTLSEMRVGRFSCEEAKEGGCSCSEAKDAGYNPRECMEAGFTVSEGLAAGYSMADHLNHHAPEFYWDHGINCHRAISDRTPISPPCLQSPPSPPPPLLSTPPPLLASGAPDVPNPLPARSPHAPPSPPPSIRSHPALSSALTPARVP